MLTAAAGVLVDPVTGERGDRGVLVPANLLDTGHPDWVNDLVDDVVYAKVLTPDMAVVAAGRFIGRHQRHLRAVEEWGRLLGWIRGRVAQPQEFAPVLRAGVPLRLYALEPDGSVRRVLDPQLMGALRLVTEQ